MAFSFGEVAEEFVHVGKLSLSYIVRLQIDALLFIKHIYENSLDSFQRDKYHLQIFDVP